MTTHTSSRSEILPPPLERSAVLGWLVKNLFNTWYNALLTLLTLAVVYFVLRGTLTWAFTDARWDVIPNNMRLFFVGQYPSAIAGQTDYIWRLGLCVYLLAALIGLTWGVRVKYPEPVGLVLVGIPVVLALIPVLYFFIARPAETPLGDVLTTAVQILAMDVIAIVGLYIGKWRGDRFKRLTNVLWIMYFPLVILLIRGFGENFDVQEAPLAAIPTRFWGGLLLSLLLSIVGIVFSFPLGVMLALGRQSKLPVMRTFSVLYIEFIRGVPLISLLFMGQVMLNLFLPSGITLDRVLRAMVPITLFSAAYLAENVRGGLQSIPKGQYEAAYALGLNGFKTMIFIILPQALRAVIPVIVGQFIGLFKDTSLVAIVGLLDLLGIARGVIANPDYIGTQREVFLFISVFYFVFSYALAYTSRRLETALGVGIR
ncbi:MAG: amino acid ABC transporter permease [Anaerolineales bacterium]|nr:amino acid ABC transporter permease [Anaerolineales bacterium]